MKNLPTKRVVFVLLATLNFFMFLYFKYIQGNTCISKRYIVSPISALVSSSRESESKSSRYLLTLFTTWRELPEKQTVINNTIKNWKSFHPNISSIVFTEKIESSHLFAKENNWKILTSRTATNESIPILKDMFARAKKEIRSEFYGYANSDILFTPLLIPTLYSVLEFVRRKNVTVLVVGQRTDISLVKMKDSNDVTNVITSGKTKGKLHHPNAVDYFITTQDFPFYDLPDVVIGRPAYDNYVIKHARAHRVSVIDATDSNPAIHQSTRAGDFEGHTHKNNDYNLNLLKSDHYISGEITCSNFKTKCINNTVKVFRKVSKPNYCVKMFESW